MGDLTFVVPPATTTATPAPPEPEPAAVAAASPRPRCRRVHFRDLAAAATLWLPPDDDAMAEEAEPPPGPEKTGGATAGDLTEEDRMDLLWEDFNEELQLAMRRSCSKAGGPELPSESTSDGEYEPPAAAGRLVQGCFPVLRPAARAGGAGHYYRRRAGSWVLLMRIFRRLFVIDKTITAR